MKYSKVNVLVKKMPDGNPLPLEIQDGEKTFQISGTGRRWVDANGLHILVTANQQVVELLYSEQENNWYRGYPSPNQAAC